MPFYVQRGRIPAKRHVAFRKEDGSIYSEHLMGNLGFTGLQSLLYTLRPPTAVVTPYPRCKMGYRPNEVPGLELIGPDPAREVDSWRKTH